MSDRAARGGGAPAPDPDGAFRSVEWRKRVGELQLEAGVRYAELLPSAPSGTGEPEAKGAISPGPAAGGEGEARAAAPSRDAKPVPEAISRWETEGGTAC